MLNVNTKFLEGKKFFVPGGTQDRFICIGVGQNPDSGAVYVVGASYDATRNVSVIRTELFKSVEFDGDITSLS